MFGRATITLGTGPHSSYLIRRSSPHTTANTCTYNGIHITTLTSPLFNVRNLVASPFLPALVPQRTSGDKFHGLLQDRRLQRSQRNMLVMVALWNRADHYIFILSFVLSSSFFSSPNLSRRRLDWMSAILAHMVWP